MRYRTRHGLGTELKSAELDARGQSLFARRSTKHPATQHERDPVSLNGRSQVRNVWLRIRLITRSSTHSGSITPLKIRSMAAACWVKIGWSVSLDLQREAQRLVAIDPTRARVHLSSGIMQPVP